VPWQQVLVQVRSDQKPPASTEGPWPGGGG
jgi:hypothetical protein